MLSKRWIGLSVTAASALWMACSAVHAEDALVVLQRPSLSTTVSIRDLDLQRSDDVARLYQRLTAAADRLCGPRAFNIFYYLMPQYQSCVDDAVHKAVKRINQPALSAYSAAADGVQPASARQATDKISLL